MFDSTDAVKILKKALRPKGCQTDKLFFYESPKGRALALDRKCKEAVFIWVEKYEGGIPGISVKNSKYPGQPYGRNQPRHSNLNEKNAPSLKIGNRAWYLEVESLFALEQLSKWYACA